MSKTFAGRASTRGRAANTRRPLGSALPAVVAAAVALQALGGSFVGTGPLATARDGHTATLLPNGKVLAVGGQGDAGVLASAELYDPGTGAWTGTGAMNAARTDHTTTLLVDGRVLVVGGSASYPACLASAELYDPATGRWTPTGSLNGGRFDHTATLLPNGKVLVSGGYNWSSELASAELYDPSTGTWVPTGSMSTDRMWHTATLLQDGIVLVVGGVRDGSFLSSAELYNPATGVWTATGAMNTARLFCTAKLLPDGRVLVAAGRCIDSSRAELYDPATGKWDKTGSMSTGREFHTAALLPDGKVLVAAGLGASGGSLSSAEQYDPATGIWTAVGSMNTARAYLPAPIPLPNGMLLFVGGTDDGTRLASAELYEPDTPAAGRTRLFAVRADGTNGTIYELNPTNGTVLLSFPAPAPVAGPHQGLALGPDSLFYIDGSSPGPHTLWELNANTGAPIHSNVVDAASPSQIAGAGYLNGRVYLERNKPGRFLVWDPTAHVVVTNLSVAADLYSGLTGAADLGVLFDMNASGQIVRIDPSTGNVLATLTPATAFLKGGLAYADGVLLASSGADGRVYRIDPATGTVLGSFVPGGSGYLGALGGDGVSGGLTQIYGFPLTTDPGWGRQGEWRFGVPAGKGGWSHGGPDPSSGATDSNVFGVNLGGDYATGTGGPFHLVTGPLDFRGVTNVVLQFQRWLNTDYQPYVQATVEGSTNGVAWTSIWSNGTNAVTDAVWTQCRYDIAEFANNCSTVYIRWSYLTGRGAYAYSGWNIDDIEFLGTVPPGSPAPASVDLISASDTGVSATDNLTNRDNSSPTKTLQFQTSGTVSGATVTLYADGIGIGDAVAGGPTTTVTTVGAYDLADGPHTVTVRQTLPGRPESADSPALSLTIDTMPPEQGQAAGALDTTFGVGGKLTVAFSQMANGVSDVAAQSDGKIVVIGNDASGGPVLLARLNPDGSLDNSFDGDGRLISSIGVTYLGATAVAVQGDGMIVAGGYVSNGSNTDFVVARLTSGGLLDTTFGGGTGKVITPVGTGNDYLYDLVVQPDGKILAGGSAVVRYNADGTLDAGFGNNGTVVFPPPIIAFTYSLLVQSDGRILAGGYTVPGGTQAVTVVRLNTNGTLDASFGLGGRVVAREAKGTARKLALQADGKIVAVGNANLGSCGELAITRFLASGTLDATFGGDGVVTTSFGMSSGTARDVGVRADGTILVAGDVDPGSNSNSVLLMYNPDGTLDASFGGAGLVVTDFGGHDYAIGTVLQSSKAIVVGRCSGVAGIVMGRYLLGANTPCLAVASDTGCNNDDHVTRDNTPTFEVSGVGGDYWRLYRGGVLVSQPPGLGDNGGIYKGPGDGVETLGPQPDGVFGYAYTLVDAAGNESMQSVELSVTIDTVPPVASSITPLPDSVLFVSGVAVDVAFSELVVGIDGSDLLLGGPAAAVAVVGTPTKIVENTWRFPVSGLDNGTLQVRLAPDVGDVEDVAGNGLIPRPTLWGYVAMTTAPLGTPVEWLRSQGFTNDYPAAETADPDHDGAETWKEYIAGTCPTNPASVFAVGGVSQRTERGFEIRWYSVSNRVYAIERATNLVSSGFAPLTNNIAATPPENVHTDVVDGLSDAYFYRIRTGQ